MKVALISPCSRDIYTPGMRNVSAYLKQHGHSTRMIFLPGDLLELRHGEERVLTYPDDVVDRVVELVQDCRLVGFSFLSQFVDRAIPLTRRIRERTGLPVIWGGIHATVHPEECLDHVDLVCEGEGEETLLELVERLEAGRDYADLPNLWLRRNGGVIRNPLRPLIQDLDRLPFMDYDIHDDWVYNERLGRIIRIDDEVLRLSMPRARDRSYKIRPFYRTMSDRGCPHACTYCIGSTLRAKYPGQRYLRARSVDHTMAELVQVTRRFPFIELIQLIDDTFFIRPLREIEEFAAKYKAQVGLPLHLQGSPTTITREKLEPLLEAGLCFVEMGIQTACDHTKEIYNRRTRNERVLEAARLLYEHRNRLLPPCYHLILDCPWEPPAGVMETLDLMLRIPGSYRLAIGSLTFFPGTPLYYRAKEEGLIKDAFHDIYRKPINWAKGNIRNVLVVATGCALVPRWVIKLLRRRLSIRLLDRPWLTPVYDRGVRFWHFLGRLEYFLRSALAGDFSAFGRIASRALRRGGLRRAARGQIESVAPEPPAGPSP